MKDTLLERIGYLWYWAPPPKHVFNSVDQVPDYLERSFPVFIALMVIEALVSRLVLKRNLYRLDETLSSVASGAASLILNLYIRDFAAKCYLYIWNNHAIYHFKEESILTYIIIMLLVDCTYYWFHRFAHVYHAPWAAHVSHHAGEDYNLATGVRQGGFQKVFSFAMYLPLALVFSPTTFAIHSSLNTLSQFWFHTSVVGNLGPLEYILNTPSHHRMHHRPPGNCNYGGFLIIFDRIFGTFQAEDEKIDYYGLAKPLDTYDSVSCNYEHWVRISQNVPVDENTFAGKYLPSIVAKSCRKRARHPYSASLKRLFEPIPVAKRSWDASGPPVRKKIAATLDLGLPTKLWLAFNMICGLLPLSLVLAGAPKGVNLLQATPAILLMAFNLSIFGRVLDARPGWRTLFFEVLRTGFMMGVYFYPELVLGNILAVADEGLRTGLIGFLSEIPGWFKSVYGVLCVFGLASVWRTCVLEGGDGGFLVKKVD